MDCRNNINNNKHNRKNRMPQRQRGIAMVLLTLGMLVVVVVAGLALDVSHALLNKTRLQNIVDMSALAAAQTLETTEDVALAAATAREIANANLALPGNAQISEDVSGDQDIIVEFSANLEPFSPGAISDAEYVRVRIETVSLASWLIQIIGIDNKPVRASAVSGPSVPLGSVCGIVPLIVCGDPSQPGSNFGFEPGNVYGLKSGSQADYDEGNIGPGNFQLASYGGSSDQGASGAAVVEKNLQQGIPNCEGVGDTIDTQPGNQIGPVADGLNNRFNCYGPNCSANDNFKYDKDGNPIASDTVITEVDPPLQLVNDGQDVEYNGILNPTSSDLNFNYEDYDATTPANYDLPISPLAQPGRRILPVVVADCSGTNTGQSTLPVLSVGCFFMLQKINGGESGGGNEGEVYGEFIESCRARGGLGPNSTNGPIKIVLYNDWNSKDS